MKNLQTPCRRVLRCGAQISLLLVPFFGITASAQTTLAAAVTMALDNSPRVKTAMDDVRRARAVVSETKDVFIPSVVANGGAGDSYGITLNVPTILTVNAQSLIYSSSQRFYLRASRLSLQGALLALQEMREQVEEDAVITYVSLDHAQQTDAALRAEYTDVEAMLTIVNKRFNAGLESELELDQTQRELLAVRLQQLQLEDERAMLRQHLSGLTGQRTPIIMTVPDSVPTIDSPTLDADPRSASAGELSATANAEARQQHALGDASYRWRPQIGFAAQYGRVSPINDVSDYYNLHGKYNVAFAGIQVQFPLFDRAHQARSEEANADAARAHHELEAIRSQREEDRQRLIHTLSELSLRSKIADLDLSIAEAQLKATTIQASRGGDGGPILNPKDEQNARVRSRQRYLDVLDARLQMKKTQISILRMSGGLESWLHLPPQKALWPMR